MDNEKITIDKAELILMITEYWALDNNENCEAATRIFLEKYGLFNDVNEWIEIGDFSHPTQLQNEEYQYSLKDRAEFLQESSHSKDYTNKGR